MKDAFTHFITALISAAMGCAAAGFSVYGDVSAMKSTLARIELRLDALATAPRVAQK